jgi:hypothetical protein
VASCATPVDATAAAVLGQADELIQGHVEVHAAAAVFPLLLLRSWMNQEIDRDGGTNGAERKEGRTRLEAAMAMSRRKERGVKKKKKKKKKKMAVSSAVEVEHRKAVLCKAVSRVVFWVFSTHFE